MLRFAGITWAATVCDLVGNNLEMQAVLKPISESPKAAYSHKSVFLFFIEDFFKFMKSTLRITYSESCTTSSNHDRVVGVVNNSVVADTLLSLKE